MCDIKPVGGAERSGAADVEAEPPSAGYDASIESQEYENKDLQTSIVTVDGC